MAGLLVFVGMFGLAAVHPVHHLKLIHPGPVTVNVTTTTFHL